MNLILEKQRMFFQSDKTKTIAFRKKMLLKLYYAVKNNEEQIYAALKSDLNKSEIESYLTELQMVYSEIRLALKKIATWQKPKKVKTPITHFPATSYIYHEPYGNVLILSPWNYPIQLALVPLVGAITGGNCAILKTSKSSKNVSYIIKKIINETFPNEYIYCASDEYSYDDILALQYDLIFFTGSENVGKTVMKAASKHLTPVVLELGGKSPCIIEKTANIKLAAKRLAWGKYLNSGQTCVAPDYVLIDSSIKESFLQEFTLQIKAMYQNPLTNPNYPKIITEHHFKRLIALIENEPNKFGGNSDKEKQIIEPTVFTNASFDDPVMKEEIFGPILPIISYENIKDVVKILKSKPKPLALYLFSENNSLTKSIINTLPFGGGCINDVIMHLANHHLPFGGAGSSGMGNYHGKFSFDTFTRNKSVLKGKSFLDIPLRYPPYTDIKLKMIYKITK